MMTSTAINSSTINNQPELKKTSAPSLAAQSVVAPPKDTVSLSPTALKAAGDVDHDGDSQ